MPLSRIRSRRTRNSVGTARVRRPAQWDLHHPDKGRPPLPPSIDGVLNDSPVTSVGSRRSCRSCRSQRSPVRLSPAPGPRLPPCLGFGRGVRPRVRGWGKGGAHRGLPPITLRAGGVCAVPLDGPPSAHGHDDVLRSARQRGTAPPFIAVLAFPKRILLRPSPTTRGWIRSGVGPGMGPGLYNTFARRADRVPTPPPLPLREQHQKSQTLTETTPTVALTWGRIYEGQRRTGMQRLRTQHLQLL